MFCCLHCLEVTHWILIGKYCIELHTGCSKIGREWKDLVLGITLGNHLKKGWLG